MLARRRRLIWLGLVAATGLGCLPSPAGGGSRTSSRMPVRSVRVLAIHPHDRTAFTQGLLWHEGRLFESLGLEGRSRLREVDLESGRVLREVALPGNEFGEGLAMVGNRLFQLTWREGVAHVWRREDFAALATFRYSGEGWGLAYDGARLIQSDGSARLTFRSPEDFRELGTLDVVRDGSPEAYLNELEVVGGALYANVWQSDEIVRIDLGTGHVTAVWSAAGLLDAEDAAGADVLNGIAWDSARKRFLITGKLWPKLFEVELPE
jgi:glutaminyl-peptide cyclotransferase